MVTLETDWDNLLKDEFQKDYYNRLRSFLKGEYCSKTIYPDVNDIFNSLKYTSYEKVRVSSDLIGDDNQ